MNDDIGLFAVIISIAIVIIGLMFNTQKTLTPGIFVTNTYLYIILAILLLSLIIIVIDKYQLININNMNGMMYFCVFIMTLLVLSAFTIIGNTNVILRNILWLVFIACMAVILYPIFDVTKSTGVFWKSIVTVIIIVLVLTMIASMVPEDFFNSWGSYLSIALLALIVFEIIDLLFSGPSGPPTGHIKIFAILAVIIFSGFLLYDTSRLYQNAKIATVQCAGQTNQLQCADYPGESLSLFLDIVNLFANTATLQSLP